MATKVRGITIELGADTSGIGKALSGLNSQISGTQKQLKDVEKLLKLDPKNTELLKQKQELLNKAIADSKTKVNALKEAQAQLGARTEENAKQYDAIEREIISCTTEQKKWQDQLDAMTPKAKTLKENLSDISQATGKAAESTKALSAAAVGVGAALLGNAYKAAQTADDINTLSKQYGIAVEEIQKMNYAQDVIDVSTETMLASYAKLTKQMGASNKTFEELGVVITDNNGELRDSEDVWYDVLDALSKVENETQRDVYAQELFGKSAADLAGVIDDGGQALREMGQEAQDAGLILSGDALANANQFNDAMDRLKATASASFLEAGAALATNLVPMLEKLVEVVTNVLTWFGDLDGTTQTIILTLAGLVASISPVLTLVSTLTGLAAGLNVAMLPMIGTIGAIIAIVAALVAGGIALYKNWNTVKSKCTALASSLKNTWKGIKSSISTSINEAKTAVSNAVANIKQKLSDSSIVSSATSTFENVANSIQGAFERAKGIVSSALAAIKYNIDSTNMDKDVNVNVYTNNYTNTRTAPASGNISWYADGYNEPIMFTRPTVLATSSGLKGFGDGAGSELVVGTNKLMSMISQAAGGTTINMTINAGNQNVNELADKVATRIQKQIDMKRSVYK